MKIVSWKLALIVMSLSVLVVVGAVVAEPPVPPKLSQVMPADDLVQQVDQFVDSTRASLVDEATYNDKARAITKEAHTLAVVAQMLALHDQEHRLKSAAPALVVAAQRLAKAKDYAAAKQAFEAVEDAADGEPTQGGPEVKWEKVAGLGQLMKQVTIINGRLKRNLRRFDERKNDNLRDAAVLAAIGQAINYDTHEVKDPSQVDKWYQLCGEMRDAAGDLNSKVRTGDKAGAEAALVNLGKTCESCHLSFQVKATP